MHGYYILYKRTLKSGNKIYYYQAYKPDGTLTYGKSTGCKSKTAAVRFCQTLLSQGRIWTGYDIPFSNYTEHFFDIDSIWVQDKLASGTPEHPALSPLYLKKLQSTVQLHLNPYFSTKKFSSIKPNDIKEFRLYLLREKQLSFKSVNNIISVLQIIIGDALAADVLTVSPLRGIKPLIKNPAPRYGFTLEEAKTILREYAWPNQSQRLFNFVAAVTGLRLSEINSLRKENVKPTYIDLRDQYLRGQLRPLKTKEARKIPICPDLYKLLSERIAQSNDGYVFYDVGATRASNTLHQILVANMPEPTKKCGYCFHSWRHFYNTYLLSQNISPLKVASVLGHSTGAGSVQENYTNFTEADYKEIYDVQSKLFNDLKFW